MKTIATVLAVVFVATLVGCSDESESASAPKVADMGVERKRVSEGIEKREGTKSNKVVKKLDAKQDEARGTVETALGPVEIDYVYDPKNRRDPFRSTFWSQPIRSSPRGPLEHYELGQLAVTAIVWESDRLRALVSDPTGSAYVVKEGSKIGKNDGLVIHIGDNLVLVKETYFDFAGEQSTKDVEMRIRTSQGG